MKSLKCLLTGLLCLLLAFPSNLKAASHREAPITAIDRLADITDFFAFVSYDNPDKVTIILNVDPLLEPANGPNYFPFDPEILYQIKIDNDNDAVEDIKYQFRFKTEIRRPGVFTSYVGAGGGINAPANSPAPVAPGTPIVPPAITALDGPGSEGLSLQQIYTVTEVVKGKKTLLSNGKRMIAVPSNVGPRTMPNYPALAKKGVYSLPGGIRVFAGTVDDPFWIDLGATFDSLNYRPGAFATGVPAVLSDAQDSDDTRNFSADDVSGYNVNTIAIEIPIAKLTRTGKKAAATDPAATIGLWGTTSRPKITIRKIKNGQPTFQHKGKYRQIQRMGNPLINEVLIGTGSKDLFSMSQPKNDTQFSNYFLDPLLARVLNSIYGSVLPVPVPPRTDLLPLVQYAPPIAAPGTTPGPIADLLRLNTGVAPTAKTSRKRLGLLAGDPAGFPNGRRVSDDVTDIAVRAVAGILSPGLNRFPYNRLGDGVNANDVPYQETFPYVGFAQSGRDSRHVDPSEPGCAFGNCVVN